MRFSLDAVGSVTYILIMKHRNIQTIQAGGSRKGGMAPASITANYGAASVSTAPAFLFEATMITFYTCNGYEPIESYTALTAPLDLPKRCRDIEAQRVDGFAVFAIQDGLVVADADGIVDHADDNREYRAQMDYACGYFD